MALVLVEVFTNATWNQAISVLFFTTIILLKDPNKENQIESTGKLQKQCFWNPLISMQKIGPKENK